MWIKQILKDAMGVWLLLTGCVATGIILNEMREKPLPLIYAPPEVQVNQAVETPGNGIMLPIRKQGDVSLEEMREISAGRAAIILDARPDIFYQVGHIPSALSLPRDDFENGYRALASLLQRHREQVLVVYCAGEDCPDSQTVGEALQHLGYPHVRLFRGGWGDWESDNLPVEKE
jgi:rhodanese-related sulfurtransferase